MKKTKTVLSTKKNHIIPEPYTSSSVHVEHDACDIVIWNLPRSGLRRSVWSSPHLHMAHQRWSSVQLVTYSMWHLLPFSYEFFISLPLFPSLTHPCVLPALPCSVCVFCKCHFYLSTVLCHCFILLFWWF